MLRPMRSHTRYLTFRTSRRREFVRITDEVQQAVDEAGVQEGLVLVSAMHITAGVWVNDDEPGILEDTLEWLDKLAPPSWQPPANDVAEALAKVIERGGHFSRSIADDLDHKPLGAAPVELGVEDLLPRA